MLALLLEERKENNKQIMEDVMKVYQQRWEVEGSMSFPVDMLRYDSCFPFSETESYKIIKCMEGNNRGPVRVIVHRYRSSGMSKEPNAQRWQSFGWKIVEGSFSESEIH
jgi:hypothetical protein